MITNIAAYQFAELSDLKALRQELIALCQSRHLRGTILLSLEGINLFVAGAAADVETLLGRLREVPGLGALTPKVSESANQPFTRMLVRIKKEIIAFGVEGIAPARYTSPRLPARELKTWLDEGRPVVLLDTRNDYEIKLGTFRGAVAAGVDHFRDFPSAVDRLPEEMKDVPIVTFCTGGIRCEKAAPYLESRGFRQVFQLEGGILKYFEECGGAHYEGECFVFDQRVGVDPALRETETAQCFACQSPLTAAEQAHASYVAGVSCPYCVDQTAAVRAAELARRNKFLAELADPLPGSVPCDNYRPVTVPASCAGVSLLEFLERILPHISRAEWEELAEAGRLCGGDRSPVGLETRVAPGQRYYVLQPAQIEPPVHADLRVLYEDEALLVLNKPAPLPMHPGGRFARNTLMHFLHQAYRPQKPHPAHRLDANTTGLVLCSRTRHFAGLLQPQFERGEVEKVYLARVHGHPVEEIFVCDLPISSSPIEAGSRAVDQEEGLPAQTDFRVIERRSDGTALLEVRPRTGRTNQIRLHLRELGFPICGDPVYGSEDSAIAFNTLMPGDPPLCLHAWKLSFRHPISQQNMIFTAPPPSWVGEGLLALDVTCSNPA